MILILDNYDSFVHNLARYIERLGVSTHVVRNDQVTVADIRQMNPQAIVLSPGPCTPSEAGCSLDVVRELHTTIPMLGVCLGHQTIAQALGGTVVRGQQPFHGRSSTIEHDERGLFAGVPSPLVVGRYHSLVVELADLPSCLEATAWTQEDDRTVMAIAHRDYPLVGVQFHPESILTEQGFQMLSNFLVMASIETTVGLAELSRSEKLHQESPRTIESRPVTF